MLIQKWKIGNWAVVTDTALITGVEAVSGQLEKNSTETMESDALGGSAT